MWKTLKLFDTSHESNARITYFLDFLWHMNVHARTTYFSIKQIRCQWSKSACCLFALMPFRFKNSVSGFVFYNIISLECCCTYFIWKEKSPTYSFSKPLNISFIAYVNVIPVVHSECFIHILRCILEHLESIWWWCHAKVYISNHAERRYIIL